jgi:hypothetical protein
VGLFESAAVKELRKKAGFFGDLVASEAFGQLPPGTAEEMIKSESQRRQLRAAFSEVVKELGHEKALKKALSAAGDHARWQAEFRKVRARELTKQAEQLVGSMLEADGSY